MRIVRILLCVVLLVITITSCSLGDNKNEETTGTYGYNVTIGGEPNEIKIYDYIIDESPKIEEQNYMADATNDALLEYIKEGIKTGKLLDDTCKEFYIIKTPIYAFVYSKPNESNGEIRGDNETAPGTRFIIASKEDFSDAQSVIYLEKDDIKKDYQLSGDMIDLLLKDIDKEMGIVLTKGRTVLIDNDNNLYEKYVNDRYFCSCEGDCFSALKNKGYVLNIGDMLKESNIERIDIE